MIMWTLHTLRSGDRFGGPTPRRRKKQMRAINILPWTMALTALAPAQNVSIKSISVGPDQSLTYPAGPANPPYLVDFPDEHTTIIPPAAGSSAYVVFAASKLSGGSGGAVVLQT